MILPRTVLAPACVAALCATLVACTMAYTTTIDHPLTSGSVQPNRIRLKRGPAEQRNDLPPGTLSFEASLISLDQNSICFDLVTRSTADRADLADPRNIKWVLGAEPPIPELSSPRISDLKPSQTHRVRGTVEQKERTKERVCKQKGGKEECSTKEVVTTTKIPADIEIITSGGKACYAHAGKISKHTSRIILKFHSGLVTWRSCEWKLR